MSTGKPEIEEAREALASIRSALARRPEPVTVREKATQIQEIDRALAEAPAPKVAVTKQATPTPSVKARQEVVLQVEAAPPATITVEPQVTVMPPVARPYNCFVTSRDTAGFILSFRIEPA